MLGKILKFGVPVALALLCDSPGAAPAARQAAIIHEIRGDKAEHTFVLDFVEVRDCNCDSGIQIVNQNKKLRSFQAGKAVKIELLKNAAEYRAATVADLEAGLAGKNYGWPFDRSTPFEFRFDAANRRILEIRQIYLP